MGGDSQVSSPKLSYNPQPQICTNNLLLPLPESMTLSKLAEGLREMYLNKDLPADPHRCNSFMPRVSLVRQEEKPNSDKKHTVVEDVYVFFFTPFYNMASKCYISFLLHGQLIVPFYIFSYHFDFRLHIS